MKKLTRILLDATPTSSLDWHLSFEEATLHEHLIWDLDLGLFSALKHPLNHEAQFKTLRLAVDHFSQMLGDALLEKSAGVILFKGERDALQEAEMEYLHLLASHLPYALDPVILVTLPKFSIELLHPECFPHFSLGSARVGGYTPDFVWENGELFKPALTTQALCLPAKGVSLAPYLPVIEALQESPYRLIEEGELHTKWEGVETLYYHGPSLATETKRQLNGFIAAGGEAINLASDRPES